MLADDDVSVVSEAGRTLSRARAAVRRALWRVAAQQAVYSPVTEAIAVEKPSLTSATIAYGNKRFESSTDSGQLR